MVDRPSHCRCACAAVLMLLIIGARAASAWSEFEHLEPPLAVRVEEIAEVTDADAPVEVLNAIPFFVALVILTAGARWARMPPGLGENYVPTT